MKKLPFLTTLLLAVAVTLPGNSQDKDSKKEKSVGGQPSESEMMAMMMQLSKPGENHKMLEATAGNWTYKVKFWMNPDPNSPPSEATGTTSTKAMMDGRFFVSHHAGKMQMPGADGKMTEMDFVGMSVEGYDNVKKKFVASWMDNMGTGIMNLEGTYNSEAKALTYTSEYEPMPGMKTKIREVITFTDKNHRKLEWFEDQGGKEARTMEITYIREK